MFRFALSATKLSWRGAVQASHDMQQRGLAAAGGTRDSNKFSPFYGKRNIGYCGNDFGPHGIDL